jgi:predicted secreted protein
MPCRRATIAVVALAALLAGCSGSEAPSAGPTTSAGATTIAGADGGDPRAFPVFIDPDQPILVAVGARFGILLPAEHSAGFRWQLVGQPDPGVLAPLGNELLTGTTALPGDGDGEVISFAARREGNATVELRYVGSDGNPDPAGRTARFSVIVTATGEPPPAPETTTTSTTSTRRR